MSHHIAEIVKALVDGEVLRKSDSGTAEAMLAVRLRNYLVRYWHIDDVKEIAPNISDEDARTVLAHVDETHDANIGINWDVLEAAVESLILESIA